ncbi:MAG: ABC transporter ATP-binding protein [Ruminococcaceae bacterium]|nr:ABC transporter ATP-binding protein [Oscillospiraceae bacterium]
MKKLLRFLKGYRKESVIAPLFKMLEALFELMIPLVVSNIIDFGIGNADRVRIFQMFAIMIALGVIGLSCSLCAQFFAAKAAVGFATALRSALFSHIQSFSYSQTDKLGTSTLITRMTSDINTVQTGVNLFLRLFMRSPFVVFGAMIMAFTINVKLALIFAAVIPILAAVVFGIMLVSIPIYKKVQQRLDRVVAKTRGNYGGTRVIRAFNKQQSEIEDFDSRNEELTRIQLFAGRISALMNPLTYIIINAAVILLIKFGAISVDSGIISQGELVALYNYMTQILVELIKLASLIITLNKCSAGAKRISAVFDTPSDIPHAPCEEEGDPDYAVEFRKVSFAYSASGDPAISNISFKVRRGETVGVIGSTGCGKSTLINLIPAFYLPTEGSVFINGKNTALYSGDELKGTVGVVPQKPSLFKGTIRSNLSWGRPDATEEELMEALRLAQAESFVLEKDGGLDEPVLQNGSNFSGGQKQRLTIARALVRRPEILILDDSASALDYATEAALRRAVASLDYDPTIFIVSQRTSSIRHADLILVLDDGELVGAGDHDSLLESCQVYKEIYSSQFTSGGEAK